ncbi:lipid-A-disaccharide synthase [Flavobacteriales bacterium]|nr:lipid-A-disaccharide synthase [Flavobacteriales bacterium]
MKLYIVTGEPSGDLHAANLVHELKTHNSNLNIRAWGGDRLIAEGVEIAKNISETAFMGLTNVILNLSAIKDHIDYCKSDILQFKPDAIILVDYPAFNLKIAEFAKSQGIKVFYYISPKVWAWNKGRISKIKNYVDHLLVIFPFEVDFYKNHGIEVNYVGNPLLDEINKDNFNISYQSDRPIVALLPGSRKQEIDMMLPEMLSIINDFPEFQFVIAATNLFSKAYYESFIITDNVAIVFNETYGLLNKSDYAIVTSGTATLEAALFKVPQIVCYKTNWFTYCIAKLAIKVNYLSLVNILMDKLLVKELIQSEFNSKNLKLELNNLINKKEPIKDDYEKLIKLLGSSGASKKSAQFIIASI